jgi:hypothetical protein
LEARGSLAEMKKYFGTAKLTNLIAAKTRKLEPKRRNQCEGINGRPPHTPVADETPLGFCHNPWRSRLDILEDCLSKYKEGDGPVTARALYYISDLDRFEHEFIAAHLPWGSSGKILCKRCDREWTATWRTGQNRETTQGIVSTTHPTGTFTKAVVVPQAVTTIEQLTVELIFQGLSKSEVLAGIRKVFPGRASMNTVAWYRSHLIHDRSPRFDKLRAGRIAPATRR